MARWQTEERWRGDEQFFRELIKNYRERGHDDWADAAYYEFRTLKRAVLPKWQQGLEFVFLDAPFAYATSPARFFLVLFSVAGVFGGFYAGFVKLTATNKSLLTTAPLTRLDLCAFAWAFYHSLDTLTPGLSLRSLDAPFLKRAPYRFDTDNRVLYWAQRVQQLIGWYMLVLFVIMFTYKWLR